MQTWNSGSTPPQGEYEFIARTGGRLRVWVTNDSVIMNGEPTELERAFNLGSLVGPIDDDTHP